MARDKLISVRVDKRLLDKCKKVISDKNIKYNHYHRCTTSYWWLNSVMSIADLLELAMEEVVKTDGKCFKVE